MKAFLAKVIALWKRLTPTVKVCLMVVLIVFLGIGSCRVIRGSINTRIAAVEAKLTDAQKARDEATASFQAALTNLKAVQTQSKASVDAANKVLSDLARANAKINLDLAAEKAKTAALTSDALASSLGTYIGAQNVYASAAIPPTFILTRTGAENTRGIFLERDALTDKLTNCGLMRDQDAVKISTCSIELGSTSNALDACKQARLSDADVIKLLQKDVSLWKSKNRWAWLKAGAPAIVVGIIVGFLAFHK